MLILHGKYGNKESNKKLFRVRHRRTNSTGECYQLRQVPLLKSSLCGQGSYILHNLNEKLEKKTIYTWYGPRANLNEKKITSKQAIYLKSCYEIIDTNKEDVNIIEMKQTAPYVTFNDHPEFWNVLIGNEVNIDENVEDQEKKKNNSIIGSLAWEPLTESGSSCQPLCDKRAYWDGVEVEMTELEQVQMPQPLLYVLRTDDTSPKVINIYVYKLLYVYSLLS